MVSCSNLPQGYFNAYACLARRADLDAILHLGDYIYEYPNKGYGDGTALGRIPSPDKEMVALQDYRARHAQYKADPDQGEGDWFVRKAAAEQAYYEWMPIREDAQTKQSRIYRAFRFGDLATVYMLDTRVIGRDEQVLRDDTAAVELAGRQLLGAAQEGWLAVGGGPDGEKQLADLRAARPHLHYVDGRYRGLFVVDPTRERLQADFYAVATVLDRTTKERFERGFVTESGRNHLTAAATAAPAVLAPDPAP